jgi:hypothetical protein
MTVYERRRVRGGRSFGFILALAVAVAAPCGVASGAGLLDFLFGTLGSPEPPSSAAPSPDAAPLPPGETAGQRGGSVAFCVRLCDGYNFPVERSGGANPLQLCSAMCPASATKMFWGSDIRYSSAPDGQRYTDLPNAFAYRTHLNPQCTCNGRNVFGLAPLDAATDPTLRPGDVVASPSGLVEFTPGRSVRTDRGTSNFTPVERYWSSGGDSRLELRTVSAAPGGRAGNLPTNGPVQP